jgi:uncharacterized membrane protein
MSDLVQQGLVLLTQLLDIAGAAFLVLGFVIATARYIVRYFQQGVALGYYRQALGRVVLIGLEVLVASTIIKTITRADNMENLKLLAIMIGIRTVLGWTISLETSGRWPWQRAPANTDNSQNS